MFWIHLLFLVESCVRRKQFSSRSSAFCGKSALRVVTKLQGQIDILTHCFHLRGWIDQFNYKLDSIKISTTKVWAKASKQCLIGTVMWLFIFSERTLLIWCNFLEQMCAKIKKKYVLWRENMQYWSNNILLKCCCNLILIRLIIITNNIYIIQIDKTLLIKVELGTFHCYIEALKLPKFSPDFSSVGTPFQIWGPMDLRLPDSNVVS